MPKRWLLLMTKENLAKCEAGAKTQTRRTNEQYLGIMAGDELYFRSDYNTTYAQASGPYLATADARSERLHDITDADALAEGVSASPYVELWEVGTGGPRPMETMPRWRFRLLWDSINDKPRSKPGGRWQDNGNVVRIEFTKPQHHEVPA
jgi:hypothetical protein